MMPPELAYERLLVALRGTRGIRNERVKRERKLVQTVLVRCRRAHQNRAPWPPVWLIEDAAECVERAATT